MKYNYLIIIVVLTIFTGCSATSQEGHMRKAMEMFNKCNFKEALSSSEEALSFNKANEKEFLVSLMIKARSEKILGKNTEAINSYELLVKNSPNIKTVEQAIKAAQALDPLISECKVTAKTNTDTHVMTQKINDLNLI